MFAFLLFTAVCSASALPALDARGVEAEETGASDAAVVVGVEEYTALPTVDYAMRDAKAVYDFLRDVRGVLIKKIRYLHKSTDVDKASVEEAVQDAASQVGPGGILWFYFAGHGIAHSETGERLLLGFGADSDHFDSRGISLNRVVELAEASGQTVLAIVDACYTGVGRGDQSITGGKRASFAVSALSAAPTPKTNVWLAAEAKQASGPINAVQHGAFTYLALGALQGWADKNGDKTVTLAEAHAFVENSLHELQLLKQTPVLNSAAPVKVALTKLVSPIRAPRFDPLGDDPKLGTVTTGSGSGSGSGALEEQLRKLEAQANANASGDTEEQLMRLSRVVRAKSKLNWNKTQALVESGGAEGRAALEAFIREFDGVSVAAGGKRTSVFIQEWHQAQAMLASYDDTQRSRKKLGGDPVQRARGMHKNPSWAMEEMARLPGVLIPGVGMNGILVGTTKARDAMAKFLPATCMGGGSRLSDRSCASISDRTLEKVETISGSLRTPHGLISAKFRISGGVVQRGTFMKGTSTAEGLVVGETDGSGVIERYGKPPGVRDVAGSYTLTWPSMGLEMTVRDDVVAKVRVYRPQ